MQRHLRPGAAIAGLEQFDVVVRRELVVLK
jgi:hypothetical protein